MNKFKTLLFLAVFGGIGLWGCDNSSSASDDNKESSAVESSSSVKSSSDDSVGSTIVSSNSAKNEQGNDSTEKDNSSNGKSSSSGSDKNKVGVSSSSTVNTTEPESSSSDVVAGSRCEKEGDSVYTQWGTADKMYVVKCVDGRWKAVRYFRLDSSQVDQRTREEKEGLDSLFNPDVAYGVFKDERDGNEYKTVTFVEGYGDIRTMFAQNLNYGTFVKLGENSDAEVQKHCYDDDEWFCDHYFGGLYTWSEAFGFPRACDTIPVGTSPACPDTVWYDPDPDVNYRGWKSIIHKQGICPDGWHILTYDEWVHAVEHTSILNAMSKTTWWYEKGSTNRTGISLMATGYVQNDSFVYRGEQTAFWYSVIAGQGVDSIGAAIALEGGILATKSNPKAVWMAGKTTKKTAFPIRCVMDKE